MKLLVTSYNPYAALRSGPGSGYPVIGMVFRQNEVIAVAEEGEWYKINQGWAERSAFRVVENLEGNNPVKSPNAPTFGTGNSTSATTVSNVKEYVPPAPSTVSGRQSARANDGSGFMTPELKESLEAQGWYGRENIPWYDKISRIGYKDVYESIRNTREYLFFTKPDLNIYSDTAGKKLNPDLASDAVMLDIHNRTPQVLHQLQRSVQGNGSSNFMYLLSNSVSSKLDMPTVTSKEYDTSSNQFGTRLYYKKHSFESDENFDFTLEFDDTKHLEVYSLFKAWNRYSDLKALGVVRPLDKYRDAMEIHDQISVYKIIVGENGMDILFFAKITGVFAKSVPRDAFSDVGERLFYSVQFKGHFVDDMDPLIIEEFNSLSKSGTNLPLYDVKNARFGGKWASNAYVTKHDHKHMPGFTYRLKWRG